MAFTIYCCGTCSSSFDAFGAMSRPEDEWDRKEKEFEALWQKGQDGDVDAKAKLKEIWDARRKTVGLRQTFFEGEIVSTLAKNNLGKEYADWIQIDGPGSGNHQSKMLWTRPGDYGEKRGKITGAGMDENVKHALAVLKNEPDDSLYEDDVVTDEWGVEIERTPAKIKLHGLNKQGKQNTSLSSITPQMLQQEIIRRRRTRLVPNEINLIGWSRGAVTCIMIANAIAKDKILKKSKVRIFAVDPVPGGVNQSMYGSMTSLPENVVEYFGVYARDEVSRNFSPVIPKMNGETTVTLLPMPGMHASVAGNSFIDKDAKVTSTFNMQGPGRITRYWAERCLNRWGTKMQRTALYNDTQLCDMYDEMLANDAEFRKMRDYAYVGMRQGYWNTYRQVYIEGTGWTSNYWTFEELGTHNSEMNMMLKKKHKTFVNWHHMAVFKRAHRNGWKRLSR